MAIEHTLDKRSLQEVIQLCSEGEKSDRGFKEEVPDPPLFW